MILSQPSTLVGNVVECGLVTCAPIQSHIENMVETTAATMAPFLLTHGIKTPVRNKPVSGPFMAPNTDTHA